MLGVVCVAVPAVPVDWARGSSGGRGSSIRGGLSDPRREHLGIGETGEL
ncbi:hypothetical protein SAMN05216368_106266 [Cryobacterium flavum]|uniref:Uncharacterized protein n=1 Tax=Cryobacterium flavum TaxID=1424659 RepID=A0A5E9GVU5_9MICO|nr:MULTISPECIES: hypothetical protein [Cryobacterium]SDN66780.1 hypothetical protein SAMN05216368_106266 [Cryobacterium flavum]